MTYFENDDLISMEAIRQAYRRLAMLYHPDKHEPEEAEKYTELFKALQNEYDDVLQGITGEQYETAKTTYRREKDLQDQIDKLMKLSRIELELCGCWIWISGDTFANKDQLKEYGFKWSKSKKAWYWGLTMTSHKHRAKYKKMEDIYNAFGRENIVSDQVQQIG